MNTAGRVTAYAVGLVVAFGGAFAVGSVVGPVGVAASAAGTEQAHVEAGGAHAEGGDDMQGMTVDEVSAAKGLSITDQGFTLQPLTDTVPADTETNYRFRIVGPDGAAVTDYTVEHDKQLHLIVVRRDLSNFQHVHPVLAADGTWTVPLTLPVAGVYRVFADFAPAGHEGAS